MYVLVRRVGVASSTHRARWAPGYRPKCVSGGGLVGSAVVFGWELDADVGAYRVGYVHHVPDVPVALYPADDQFDLVVSRLDPRVVHVPADRVLDMLLVAFDLDVRFPECRNPFNRYSRYGFGSSAFQLRAPSSASITHSTTWNGQTQRSHPCVDPSTQSVIQRAPSPATS